MNGIFDESSVVKKYEFRRPLLSEIDSIVYKCIRDCFNKYYHSHRFTLEYHSNFTNKINNEVYTSSIGNIFHIYSYEIDKKLKIAPRKGFKFDQIYKLT